MVTAESHPYFFSYIGAFYFSSPPFRKEIIGPEPRTLHNTYRHLLWVQYLEYLLLIFNFLFYYAELLNLATIFQPVDM